MINVHNRPLWRLLHFVAEVRNTVTLKKLFTSPHTATPNKLFAFPHTATPNKHEYIPIGWEKINKDNEHLTTKVIRRAHTVNCGCLKLTTECWLRRNAILLVHNKWFERFIMFVILSNCVTMAID